MSGGMINLKQFTNSPSSECWQWCYNCSKLLVLNRDQKTFQTFTWQLGSTCMSLHVTRFTRSSLHQCTASDKYRVRRVDYEATQPIPQVLVHQYTNVCTYSLQCANSHNVFPKPEGHFSGAHLAVSTALSHQQPAATVNGNIHLVARSWSRNDQMMSSGWITSTTYQITTVEEHIKHCPQLS